MLAFYNPSDCSTLTSLTYALSTRLTQLLFIFGWSSPPSVLNSTEVCLNTPQQHLQTPHTSFGSILQSTFPGRISSNQKSKACPTVPSFQPHILSSYFYHCYHETLQILLLHLLLGSIILSCRTS